MSIRLVVAGRFGYRGLISEAEYEEVDWGSSADDTVKFQIEGGHTIYLNYSTVGSLNFGAPSAPSIGDHPVWRVNARGPFGGADCFVDEENKDLIVAALDDPTGIATFTTVYGIEIRLMMANMARIEISEDSLTISPP
jgi:hypothetical protein